MGISNFLISFVQHLQFLHFHAMALKFGAASFHIKPSSHSPPPPLFLISKHTHHHLSLKLSFSSSSFRATVQSEGTEGLTEKEPPDSNGYLSSARTQIDLLEQLTSTSSSSEGCMSDREFRRSTIREQLAQLFGDNEGLDFSIPLGKDLKKVTATFLTTSQKRNIKRQTYLNDVSKRNDTVFFATIGAFVILPPIVILAVAVSTGYVNLLP